MNRVFVTGSNGLLGTNLVMRLSEQGFEVDALVRNKGNFLKPNLHNLNLVEGDVSNVQKLKEQMNGCSYVVHIAAKTSQDLLKAKDYYETNVQGTQNIVDACIENKIEKLIYIGTANTFGYGSASNPGNEELPMKSPFTKSLYARSKEQAQVVIDNAATKLNITTISPTFMLGPNDSKPSSGRILVRALNKRFVFYPSGGKNFIHVSDVVVAIIKAFSLDKSGQKFILANENLSYQEFYQKVVNQNNQKTRLIQIPDFILMAMGKLGDFFRLMGVKTDVSSINTEILTIKNYYTNAKVKKALKMEFTPVEQAVDEALEYIKKMS